MLQKLLIILSTAEPSRSLLVHLAPRCNTIQCKHDAFGRLKQIDDSVDVIKDLNPYLLKFFGHELRLEDDRVILNNKGRYSHTFIDDAVHI